MDNSDGPFYMDVPDAKKLYKAVRETIERTPFTAGAQVTLRLGPTGEGVKKVSFILNLNQ
jgi:hypothetical protein